MKDIFDATILCDECGAKMQPTTIEKQGFRLRAVECPKCNDKIIHPADLGKLEHFNSLKRKSFNVKLRLVGNSHAVSIPKEIFDFINGAHGRMRKNMDDMVRLCLEDFGRLSLNFFSEEEKARWQKVRQ